MQFLGFMVEADRTVINKKSKMSQSNIKTNVAVTTLNIIQQCELT